MSTAIDHGCEHVRVCIYVIVTNGCVYTAQINAGMLLMGIIKEVREADALVSLPNNLTGFVEVDEVRAMVYTHT